MNKFLAIAMASAMALCMAGPTGARAGNPAAAIGLTASAAHPAVINNVGGKTTIDAAVKNTAPDGSVDLDYNIQFALPYGTSPPAPDSLSPGTMQEWTYEFDATLLPQPIQDQFYPTVVSVTAPGASNNPQSKTVMVEVKNPATPMFVINMAGVGPVPVEEPRFAPEQFAATGGGETFAAAAPNVIGDPPFDAALDFDNLLDDVGSPEITARNVDLFKNLPPLQEGEDLATAGRKPFDVYVDFSHTGTFTKTFYLLFSDEDLPGARPPESIVRTLTYTFIVVPEPASVVLIALGVCVFGATTIRGSRQRASLQQGRGMRSG